MKLIEIYLIGVQIEIYLSILVFMFVRPVSDRRRILLFQVERRGVGDTHITGRHFGGDTHITSDMCVGIHISL